MSASVLTVNMPAEQITAVPGHPISASVLTVNMSAEQSTAVQAQGLRIIVAKMVEVNGEEEYNIVFQSAPPMQINKFEWKDKYSIAATEVKFAVNGMVSSNRPEAIKFGETMIMAENNKDIIITDPDVGPLSFGFHNKCLKPQGVVIFCKTGEGAALPISIYIKKVPVGPNIMETFTPLPKVVVWLAGKIKIGTMIDEAHGERMEVDFTGKENVEITYGDNGKWKSG